MGTDATERWDLKSFRAWAAPHFKQKPAWTFVPTRRNLTVSPGGEVAWFDEVLGSAAYGQCRGSGVLHRVGGDWKIAHYILSLPVPNDLIDRVVGGTRSWRRAVEAGHSVEAALLPRTVYIVRHAEKVLSGKDPELTPAGHSRAAALARMLPSKGLDHVFATEFKRTRQTVEPAAKIAGQSVKVVSAGDPAGLVRRLMAMESGATALVAGHSNTIGPILVALGLKGKVTITEQQHDDLFVVSLDHAGVPSLQHLQHRVTPPGAGKK